MAWLCVIRHKICTSVSFRSMLLIAGVRPLFLKEKKNIENEKNEGRRVRLSAMHRKKRCRETRKAKPSHP